MAEITNIQEIAQAVVDFANKYPSMSLNAIYFVVPIPKAALTKAMETAELEIADRDEDATSPQRVIGRLYPNFTAAHEFLDDLQAVQEMEVQRAVKSEPEAPAEDAESPSENAERNDPESEDNGLDQDKEV